MNEDPTKAPASRDHDSWAPNIERLSADGGVNVGGRRLTGPQQGFGPMWQKTYKVSIPGVAPERVISEWKANYGSFWPSHSRFNAPVAGIKPGEVGNIQAMQVMSTGIMVLFADDTSFAFMTPEGHPFAGWITFSAYEDEGEDLMWQHTLRSLAAHFGSDAKPETELVKVDRKRLWRNAGNITKNAAIGSAIHLVKAPVRAIRRST
jgi:hypothetical protein